MIPAHIPNALTGMLCLFFTSLYGQVPTFQKVYGGTNSEIISDIVETPDGYLIAGQAYNSTNQQQGALLVRMDKKGAVLWKKSYNEPGTLAFNNILPANDGGFLAWGFSQPLNNSSTDAWLIKLDDAGNVVWQKISNPDGNSEMSTGKIIPLPNSYILSGTVIKSGHSESFALRVNNQGDTLWTRVTDASGDNALSAQYVVDSLLYLSGSVGEFGCWRTMNAATGNIVQSRAYKVGKTNRFNDMLRLPDGNHLMTGEVYNDTPGANPVDGWVQKVDPAGQVLWSKTYSFAVNNNIFASQVLPDGSCVFGLGYKLSLGSNLSYMALVKIDTAGKVLWARRLSSAKSVFLRRIISTSDGGIFAAGFTLASSAQGGLDAYWIKTDSLGYTDACCSPNVGVIVKDAAVTLSQEPYGWTNFNNMVAYTLAKPGTAPLVVQDFCSMAQPTLSKTILFCPGETVTLGGTAYSQPGTVTLRLPSNNEDCDTLVTYTLEYTTANYPGNLQLTCPGNQDIVVPAGTTAMPVSYDLPAATSDCPCPGTPVQLSAGGASGSSFPVGNNLVCYRAEDACGGEKTCCFTIRLEEENTCDVKTNGCLKFELLQVNRDTAKHWVYRIRITNSCSADIAYAFIQLPDGVQAIAPAANSLYAAPGGHHYFVRNPNFSPFYSVRFQPSGAGFGGGASEVFRYVLPEQTNIDYIHVAVRLATGSYVETHLNTFYCPVGNEPAPVAFLPGANRNAAAAPPTLTVSPNPASNDSELRISGAQFNSGMFYLQDITGKIVLESSIADNRLEVVPAGLAKGIYYFKVLEHGLLLGTGKLVIL